MKNVIKGLAFASIVLFLAACKNDKPASENASAISAATTPAATVETPAATTTATPVAAPSASIATPTPAPVKAAEGAVKAVAASAETPKVTPNTANATPAPPVVANGKTTSAKFDETSYDWGTIAEGEHGERGFGFDKLFIPFDFVEGTSGPGETFAQMSAATKNAISHRGRAFRALVEALRQRTQG